MKVGASNADIVKIGKLAAQKVSPAKISKILGIKENVVKSFMPKPVIKKDK